MRGNPTKYKFVFSASYKIDADDAYIRYSDVDIYLPTEPTHKTSTRRCIRGTAAAAATSSTTAAACAATAPVPYPVVKTEVEVASKADPTGALLIEAVAGGWATPVENNPCVLHDGAEVRIAFPSKLADPGGEFKTDATGAAYSQVHHVTLAIYCIFRY